MKRVLAILGVVAAATAIGAIPSDDGRCAATYFDYGLTVYGGCPVGTLRQTAELTVTNLRRTAEGHLTLTPTAHYTFAEADREETLEVPELSATALAIIDARGVARPLPATWRGKSATFKMPEVVDGDYLMRVTYETALGEGTLDAKLPLYTPARIHVLTDRPLYEPGNTVRFRALALRARDLSPLDGRPGKWLVKDPDGEVLLEESAPAGDWGVVAGSFPIDKQARTGTWTVAWTSGAATDEVAFTVEPFKLPRFRVDAAMDKPFYRVNDRPTLTGVVLYSSGAPVAKAKLDLAWDIAGAWPPPLDWQDRALPKKAQTGANGRFELALPTIPADLQGTVTLTARISAVDPAGDRVESRVSALLSEDGITASSVTELGDGLVEGFNNRLYVRVATPDGAVVRKQKVLLRRAWDPTDKGSLAELDEDGVASLQIDPGAAVNITIPPVPYRPQPKAALVGRGEIEDLMGGDGASLADQVEMDRWLVPLGACAKWFGAGGDEGIGDGNAELAMRADRGGSLVTVGGDPSPLGQCAANVVRGKRLPPGADRLYKVTFAFTDPELPTLGVQTVSAFDAPDGLATEIARLAKGTRDCLPSDAAGALPRALTWRVTRGAKQVELGTWIDVPDSAPATAKALGCVTQRFGSRIELEEPAVTDSLGIIKFSLSPSASPVDARPQPTTMLGYELLVSVPGLEGTPSTKLRISPGSVPPLRLRVTPSLAKAGGKVTAELIRGPAFHGTLPEELLVKHLTGEAKVKLDKERKAEITIDPKAEGWVEISGGGQRALVFVKPQTDLTVSIEPKQPRYKPGDQAQLDVETKISGTGSKAAVGLFGVDASLGQLVTLDGPDSMDKLQPQVTTQSLAFGVLDGQALTLGRIRGVNAAAATVLRVTAIPAAPELDAEIFASAQTHFDPLEELTDNFFAVLSELHVQARAWEASAAPGAQMHPELMATLWARAIAACKARGERVVDAYGRELRLSLLPGDLLSLTDPRAVVVVATRLPEDVENWAQWVAKERP